jgi:hypothetical protein
MALSLPVLLPPLVVAIASREASGITGVNLVVDAGLTANHFIMETFPGGSGPDGEDSKVP